MVTFVFRLHPDGELYAGTVSNFQGNEPVIYKSLGQGTALKTENSLKWLQGKRSSIRSAHTHTHRSAIMYPTAQISSKRRHH